jgi:F-type H+-transporting ATPase subunit epsilon
MGILPNHAPLLTTLKLGVITVRAQGKEERFTVSGGVAEVQPEIVTVLATAAENIEEIDVARAETARKRAEEVLAKGVPHDTDAYLAMEAALKRSNLRLDAVKRYRRGPGRPTRRADE